MNVILTQEWVLVGSSDNLELLGGLVIAKPAPARALDGSSLGIHLLLEVLEAAKVSLDLVVEDTRGGNLDLSRAGGSKVLPEELQIMLEGAHMSASVNLLLILTEWLLTFKIQLASISANEISHNSHVTTTVELEGRLKGNSSLEVASSRGLLERLLSGVETVDVSLVVLGVVEIHNLS